MQHTVRRIPKALDEALRQRAKLEGKSLNQVTIEALSRGMGFSEEVRRQRDLSDLAGTWVSDPDFDQAIEDQKAIDEDLWK